MSPSAAKDESRAVAYYRVSSQSQADSGLGLEAQKAAIEAYAKAHRLTITSSHTDAGISGKLGIEDRPALGAALNACTEQQAGVFLVSKSCRLSRDVLTSLTIEKMLRSSGVKLVSAAGEGTESDDPSSVLLRNILRSVNAHEAAIISARTKAALVAKKARGERMGRPSVGWRVVGGRLVVDEEKVRKVTLAMALRSAGLGLASVGRELGVSHVTVSNWTKKFIDDPESYTAWVDRIEATRQDSP